MTRNQVRLTSKRVFTRRLRPPPVITARLQQQLITQQGHKRHLLDTSQRRRQQVPLTAADKCLVRARMDLVKVRAAPKRTAADSSSSNRHTAKQRLSQCPMESQTRPEVNRPTSRTSTSNRSSTSRVDCHRARRATDSIS